VPRYSQPVDGIPPAARTKTPPTQGIGGATDWPEKLRRA
jgi:hypothetical protein